MTKYYTQDGLLGTGGITRELASESAAIGASGDVISITPPNDRRVLVFYAQSQTTTPETSLTMRINDEIVTSARDAAASNSLFRSVLGFETVVSCGVGEEFRITKDSGPLTEGITVIYQIVE